jgi:HAMP domain-containing protein
MAALVAQHKDVVYVCFVDEALETDRLLAHTPEPDETLRAIAEDPKRVPPDGRVRRIGDETVVDITETTNTIPAYSLHLGLRKQAIDERTRDVFVKMGVIALVIAGAAVAVAFGAINLIAGPVEKLADQATRLSLGDMRVTFTPRGHGEVGCLADALDRLKESVLCALRRYAPRAAAGQGAPQPGTRTSSAQAAAAAPAAPSRGKK